LRKSLDEPLSDPNLVSKNSSETDVLVALDVEHLYHVYPVLDAILSVGHYEDSQISDDSR